MPIGMPICVFQQRLLESLLFESCKNARRPFTFEEQFEVLGRDEVQTPPFFRWYQMRISPRERSGRELSIDWNARCQGNGRSESQHFS
jgi:hypothetical protein